MQTTQKLQYVLVTFQVLVLVIFSVAAFVHVAQGNAFDASPVELSWFNPFAVGDFGAVVAGLSLSIFIFWGWDVTLTMNEETKDPEKTPGRAATLTVLTIVALYLLISVSLLAFAGTGAEGLGLGNEDIQSNVFFYLSGPILGPARVPGLAGGADQFGVVAAVDVRLARAHPARDGTLRSAAEAVRRGEPAVLHAGLRDDRLGDRGVGLLRRHALHQRGRPVGHDHHARHDDLLLLRHHGVRVRLVLPQAVVRHDQERVLHVPVPAHRRRDPDLPVRQDAHRQHGARTTAADRTSAASAWCSSSASW